MSLLSALMTTNDYFIAPWSSSWKETTLCSNSSHFCPIVTLILTVLVLLIQCFRVIIPSRDAEQWEKVHASEIFP